MTSTKFAAVCFVVLLASLSYAIPDFAGIFSRLDDLILQALRPTCAQEGQQPYYDRPCCAGLEEQGIFGETACARPQQTVQTETQAEAITEALASVAETCYDDSYCRLTGKGTRCTDGRCYFDNTLQPIHEDTKYYEQPENVQDYRPSPQQCSNSNCRKTFGDNYMCYDKAGKCVPVIFSDFDSSCYSDDHCRRSNPGYVCNTETHSCVRVDYCSSTKNCRDVDSSFYFGENSVCNPRTNQCVVKMELTQEEIRMNNEPEYRGKDADILFVPLGYTQAEQKDFIEGANSQLEFFRRISPSSCFPKIAYIQAGSCSQKCDSSCCLDHAMDCAVNNGYIFSRRVVGIIKPVTGEYKVTGCANQPGFKSSVIGGVYTTVLAHELGHNFGLCHVWSPSVASFCHKITDSCLDYCQNKVDCNPLLSEVMLDVMSYCPKRNAYGKIGYNIIENQCNRNYGKAKVAAAYMTISRSGPAELHSVYIGEAEIETEAGNFILSALDNGQEIAKASFNAQFSLHADIEDESGMHEEPVELEETSVVVKIPYDEKMDEIKITHNGQTLLATDLSQIAREGNLFAETEDGTKQIWVTAEEASRLVGVHAGDVEFSLEDASYTVKYEEPYYALGFIPWGTRTAEKEIDATDQQTIANNDEQLNEQQIAAEERPWWQFWG